MMTKSTKDLSQHCCIGIPIRFSDHDIKILRIADISTKDWKKNRINPIGKIYTNPDEGPMLLPVKIGNNTIQVEHDNVSIWMWKEGTNAEEYDVIPYAHLPKPPCKYIYYALIFLQNPEHMPEVTGHMKFMSSDDELAHTLENGIVVPDTFSDNLLVVYDSDENHYLCVEITKATSCLRYDQLLFVTDRKSLARYSVEKDDVIDSFHSQYQTLFQEIQVNQTRRLVYQKMKLSPKDKLEDLNLHTNPVRFARYFKRIATRLGYSDDEVKSINKIINEALSDPKAQTTFTVSPESKQQFELQTQVINSYLSNYNDVEEFIGGIIEHIPKINEVYINKIHYIANQELFEKKKTLEEEITDLKNKADEIKGEIYKITAQRSAETEALATIRKIVESEGERLRLEQKNQIQQEIKQFEKHQKELVHEDIAKFKKEQLQVITQENDQFRIKQQNAIQNYLKPLHEKKDKIQNDIVALEASKVQLESDISVKQQILEELSQLEQKRQYLEITNEQLTTFCEQKSLELQQNPGKALGNLALLKGLILDRKENVTPVSNSGLFIQSAKEYGSNPIEITDVESLISGIKNNLENIGVYDEYAEILAKIIAGAYLTRTPLLLTGCNLHLIVNAISVTLHAQTPEIISVPTGYNDYSSLLDAVKNTCGNVILVQNAIGSIDEYCYTHLMKDIANEKPDKYVIFALDFAETMRILPPSILGYMVLVNSEDVITSVATEDLDPSNCTIVVPTKTKVNVRGLYQKIAKLSCGGNVTNGYNLTRSAIFATVIATDGASAYDMVLLELATYCKLLGTTNDLNQRLDDLGRDDLKKIAEKLLGGE